MLASVSRPKKSWVALLGVEQRAGAREHAIEHRLRELAREGVLLARVIGREEHHARGQAMLAAMRERRGGTRHERARPHLGGEKAVVLHLTERDNDPHPRQQPELAEQVAPAGRDLERRRTVGRWRTAGHRGDEGVPQAKPVIPVQGGRLVGEAGAVERGVEPVATLVAGEDAAGAIAAVRGWRQPDDQETGARITEAGNGPAPVRPVAEAGHLLARHPLAMLDQPGAEPAASEPLLEAGERLTPRTGPRR